VNEGVYNGNLRNNRIVLISSQTQNKLNYENKIISGTEFLHTPFKKLHKAHPLRRIFYINLGTGWGEFEPQKLIVKDTTMS